ncbi:MAG TPA: TadE/TadG family type IV pilus assembly protein [Sphingomicrobium sp.]|nr:TadE/TadG family type IV pilus assembly protein [Sphingomicrobium sp.]
MSRLLHLRRNERGAAAIEFAIAVPILVLFIYGIFRLGLLFQANAGMQHALGEGARYATIYPTPSNSQIQTRMNSKLFGSGYGAFTVAAPVDGTGFKTLTVTYTTPMDFLLVPGPTVTITRTKKVYIAI